MEQHYNTLFITEKQYISKQQQEEDNNNESKEPDYNKDQMNLRKRAR